MKNHLINYTKYNLWANQKVCDFLKTLSEEQVNKEIISSFSSLKKTMLHIWDAQVIWQRRLQGETITTFPSKSFNGTFEEAVNGFLKSSKEHFLIKLMNQNMI